MTYSVYTLTLCDALERTGTLAVIAEDFES